MATRPALRRGAMRCPARRAGCTAGQSSEQSYFQPVATPPAPIAVPRVIQHAANLGLWRHVVRLCVVLRVHDACRQLSCSLLPSSLAALRQQERDLHSVHAHSLFGADSAFDPPYPVLTKRPGPGGADGHQHNNNTGRWISPHVRWGRRHQRQVGPDGASDCKK